MGGSWQKYFNFAHLEDSLGLEYLRHDKPLHPTRVQAHMKHVPKYLLPRLVSAPAIEAEESQVGFVPFKKSSARGRGRARARGSRGGGGRRPRREEKI